MGNGLGDNEEKERPRNGTIVEYGRRMSGNFLREIWGEEGEESQNRENKNGPDHFRQHIRPFGPIHGANSI